ncbi:hypothetical protein [Azospirillum doebereinerae]
MTEGPKIANTVLTGTALIGAMFVASCSGLHPPALAAAEPGAEAALERMAPHPCNHVVAEVLAGAQVPVSRVDHMTYGLYRDDRTGNITMYDAWLALKDQPGSLIVQVNPSCELAQVYTRGGAKVPQVAEW